jgi:hypothetical protein
VPPTALGTKPLERKLSCALTFQTTSGFLHDL